MLKHRFDITYLCLVAPNATQAITTIKYDPTMLAEVVFLRAVVGHISLSPALLLHKD